MALLGTTLFAGLGTWQFYRAQEKHELQQQMDRRHQQPPFEITGSNQNITDSIYSPVTAHGYFDRQHEILVDNEVYKGKAGYHVLTPLRLQDNNNVVLVNRGWVALGKSRDVLPDITTPEGPVEITGTITPFKSRPALILDDSTAIGKVWPFFDYEKYKSHTGYNLLPVLIQMNKNSPHGFVRDWPVYTAREAMHIGYSIQWFAFAAIVVATYLGLNIKKKQV